MSTTSQHYWNVCMESVQRSAWCTVAAQYTGDVVISQVCRPIWWERRTISQETPGFNISDLIPFGKAALSLSILRGSHITSIKGEDTQGEFSLSKGCWRSACQQNFWNSSYGLGGEAAPCSVYPRNRTRALGAQPPPRCIFRQGHRESLQAITHMLQRFALRNENTVDTGGLATDPRRVT